MTTSDPTTGDHDELLAEYGEFDIELHDISMLLDISGRLAAALRGEQSARQAAEAELTALHEVYRGRLDAGMRLAQMLESERDALQQRIDVIRGWNALPNGRARYRELDRLVNTEAWIDPDAESTLDPEPWHETYGSRHAWTERCIGAACFFDPRPEFSQNPADYGIEALHE